MRLTTTRSLLHGCAVALITAVAALPLQSQAAVPNPCSLVTVAEMQAIVGKLSEPPKATDPASGEITCSFQPVKGPSFVDVTLHDGELKEWRSRNGGKTPVALPELGKDAFANTVSNDYVDLYAKKGAVVVRVTMPIGPNALAMTKAIAVKALSRL